MPDLKGEKSDERRIIYYEMPQVVRKDGRFLQRLLEQQEGIWRHLMDVYYEEAGSGNEIPVDAAQLDHVLKNNSEREETFFQKYFRLEEGAYLDLVTFNNCLDQYLGTTFAGVNEFKQGFDLWVQRELKLPGKWWYKNEATGGKTIRGYKGFTLKDGSGTLASGNI